MAAVKRARQQTNRPATIPLEVKFANNELDPFNGWDSEGYDAYVADSDGNIDVEHRTMLFGCSAHSHDPLTGIKLTTLDMLYYLVDMKKRYPKYINIIFSGEYDFNQLIQDLHPRAIRNLVRTGSCYYKGFTIEHIPRKFFRIIPPWYKTHCPSIVIYDIYSFFMSSYEAAINKFGIGNANQRATISDGKAARGTFTYADMRYVRTYWRSEIGLLPRLGDSIRTTCYRSGFFLNKWYGPGAIAKYMLKVNGTQQKMSKKNPVKFPPEVVDARAYAYAGGRFQLFLAGLFYGPVYSVDLNSAYVGAMRYVPRLDNGQWTSIDPGEARSHIQDFALYRIRYEAGRDRGYLLPCPLFRRSRDGVDWPRTVTGWYWGPEARLVADDPDASFLQAWVWSGTEMAFPWVEEYYNERLRLQKLGDPAEKTYKWGLASMYGTCAQQAGWDRTTRSEPSSHQIEWAGFITSWCRAQMQSAALPIAQTGGLVSIDTDGITSLTPISGLDSGVALGQWKFTTYRGIIQWQNGVYWLLNDQGEWETKSRGLKRGTIKPEQAMAAIEVMEAKGTLADGLARGMTRQEFFRDKMDCTVTVPRRTYVGYRAVSHTARWDHWRHWESKPHTLQFGSHQHHAGGCRRCNGNGSSPMHDCMVVPIRKDETESQAYRIEWLQPDPMYFDPEGAMMVEEDEIYEDIYEGR